MTGEQQMPQYPKSYWREELTLPSFPTLDQSIKTEVAIVGGGITGITAAYLLAKQNINVVLLDAGKILNGTTGHTTAKITAQHGLIYDEFIQHFGLEKTLLYYQAAMEAKQFIEEMTTDLNIKCSFQKEDAYLYTNSNEYITKLEQEKKAYDQLNIDSELTDQMPLDIPVKSVLKMKNQAQFHPLNYLKTVVDEAIKNGAHFYENTTAFDIEHNKNPTIMTREGHRISCDYIIQASHFPFYDSEGMYFSRMYAERSYIIAGKTEEKFPGGMYINAEDPTRSIRITPERGKHLWLIGGENHKTGQGESTITHYQALQKFAKKHFNINEVSYRWSAQDVTTIDKMPYIGPMTKSADNIFIATGFRKWGMTNGTIAAKLLTDKILQKDNPYEEIFKPSRFQADPSVRKFIRTNADVAKHMIRGKLEYTGNRVENLSADDATITRINGKRTGVYKDKDSNLHMVDTTCTHMGCEVTWNSGDRTWDCPCHGSRFSYSGEIIEGPAKKPLPKINMDK